MGVVLPFFPTICVENMAESVERATLSGEHQTHLKRAQIVINCMRKHDELNSLNIGCKNDRNVLMRKCMYHIKWSDKP